MRLVDVYQDGPTPATIDTLYRLLEQRTAAESISHQAMPSLREHADFVRSRPYEAWYVIHDPEDPAGAVYLTRNDEIGIFILRAHRRNGISRRTVKALMEKHPGARYLANINPDNAASIGLFEGLGFRHIQNTYELRDEI
jgi:RimJ/RimL family protein N-acetyltransferase